MKYVGSFAEALLELQSQSVETNGTAFSRLERRSGVDPLIIAASLSQEERQRFWSHPGNLDQVILVTHSGQLRLFFLQAHAGHIVGGFSVKPDKVFAGRIGERRL